MAKRRLTRRNVLTSAGAVGIAGLAGCTGNDDKNDTTNDDKSGNDNGTGGMTKTTKNVSGTVKIGVLQPISGSLKYYG